MTDYERLKAWLTMAGIHFLDSKTAFDDAPFIAIWTSNTNDSCFTFYFNHDGSFNDCENINEYD